MVRAEGWPGAVRLSLRPEAGGARLRREDAVPSSTTREAATPRQAGASGRGGFDVCTPNPFPRESQGRRVLRPLLAFACLALTAFLLAPTVQSVHQQVEDLDIKRDLPRIWKWGQPEPPNLIPPICDDSRVQTYSEVDRWPARMKKDEPITVGGFVRVQDARGRGVGAMTVEIFLNETKSLPGVKLGMASTGGDGRFTLTTSVPFEIQATKYHLVAHALEKQEGCTRYLEHWSDPEMEVTSRTRVEVYPVTDAVAGHPFTIRGRVLDAVDAPVRNANVTFTLDGASRTVRTDGSGAFSLEHNVSAPKTVTYEARFNGNKYYGSSAVDGVIKVGREDLRLDASSLELVRSRPTSFGGTLVLPPGTRPQPLLFAFQGVQVVACGGCAPTSRVNVTPDAEGRFRMELVAPSDQPAGPIRVNVTGGGLAQPREIPGRVVIPVNLTLAAEGTGPVSHGLDGSVRLLDEVGRPYPGTVAIETGGAWLGGPVDRNGTYAFSTSTACGPQRVRALYNGTDAAMPGIAEQEVTVCPLLATIPPWLLAVPWWVWPLAVLVLVGAAMWLRRWLTATAETITRGPPLTLGHTRPADAAAGMVGVGETATLTAFLEEPLPEGHTLRMGLARKTVPVEVGPDLRAEHHVTPERLGEVPVRAEILDARGRVVTRRTATLRAVRYGEEIERRYRLLRGASGVSESVSPREFESWLRARAPGLDPVVAARLVGVFEEADYGPRDAGRKELVAYLEAETSLPEVTAPVVA